QTAGATRPIGAAGAASRIPSPPAAPACCIASRSRRDGMNCFNHDRVAAVGICGVCQKAVCRDCIARDTPRIVCRTCVERGGVLYGFEYRSAMSIGTRPLIHVCAGVDPATMRPKVAKGVIAVGNVAVGGVALGGLACGLVTIGGASIGLLGALGGFAVGVGFSIGGFAIGS